MLLTLLSPHFGYQMIAGHDELEHGFVSSAHDGNEGHHHDHESDAHAFLGHLLGHHLPLHFTRTAPLMPDQRAILDLVVLPASFDPRISEPPFIPPRPPFLI
jgi:hypothetical protein